MGLIVQKYGGTSVADINRINSVADRIIESRARGHNLVVVVSAMAGQTDELIASAKHAVAEPDPRELDVLVAVGEQRSAALLSMVLKSKGVDACSLMGHQVAVRTDSVFGNARIRAIDNRRIMKELAQDRVVVVAGFQGTNEDNDVTTLGRGGSDTTAVALAAVLNAEVCEIYTDVDGVFSTDPNLCARAKKLSRISYDEMLELASLGAKVLEIRAVESAKVHNVKIHVRSSFTYEEGTMVVSETRDMEKVLVSGVTYDRNTARITVKKVPDRPGVSSRLFKPVSDAGIVVDVIVQNTNEDGYTDLTFTVTKADFQRTMKLVGEVAADIGAEKVMGDMDIAKVSIVGAGMRSHAGVAQKMFQALADESINIMMISTSEIKVSCVIEEKYTELAVRVLHKSFDLEANGRE
jgi:aspartate kinase